MEELEDNLKKKAELKARKKEIRRKLIFYPMSALVALIGFIGFINPEISNSSNSGLLLIILGLGYLIVDGILLSKNAKRRKQDKE